jgi:hypothetical protein
MKLGCCFAQGIEPASARVSTMAITSVVRFLTFMKNPGFWFFFKNEFWVLVFGLASSSEIQTQFGST